MTSGPDAPWAAELITSAGNAVVKRIRHLATRRAREAEQATLVEGIQPVRQAAEAGFTIDTLVVAPGLLHSASARAFVDERHRAGVRVAALSDELFTRVSGRDRPAGLAAIVATRATAPAELVLGDRPVVVALERIGNPGNLGTVLRTADATGAAAVALVGPTVDPWDPAVIKASMGAVFAVPTVRFESVDDLLRWAADGELTVVTTAGRAPQPLWQTRFGDRLVLLLGGEGPGLSDQTLARGRLQVGIPMVGTAESLNVGVAAGVLLYEVWRQRTEL